MTNGKFRKAFKSPKIDWCAFMGGNGKSLENAFAKSVVESFRNEIPALFQECPFKGNFVIINGTFNKNLMIMTPPNFYNLYVKILNADQAAKAIIEVELSLQILP